jgi:hypothetical protein
LRRCLLVSLPLALLARNSFVDTNACPPERITLTPRDWTTLRQAPPPDIAADPERARLWSKKTDDELSYYTYFDVRGCGKQAIMQCDADGGAWECVERASAGS